MQENDFEKQVKQRMDEFRLGPSEPVWVQVEKELRKKRRRRLILVPLLVLLLAGGYFTWDSVFSENKVAGTAKETLIHDKTGEKNDPATETADKPGAGQNNRAMNAEKAAPGNKTELAGETGLTGIRKEPAAGTIKDEIKNKTTATGEKSVRLAGIKDKTQSNYPYNIKQVKKNKPGHREIQRVNENDNDPVLTADGNIARPAIEENNGNTVSADQEMVADKNPVFIEYNLRNGTTADSMIPNSLTGLQLPTLKSPDLSFYKNRGLKVGIVVAGGASTRTDALLHVNSLEEKAFAAPVNLGGTPLSTINGGVLISPPSEVKPGPAFKAGVMVLKPVSKRFDISAGLLYSYSSDIIKVGETVSVASYYNNSFLANVRAQASGAGTNAKKESHTNRYHFIELPVSVYFNLAPGWKVPLVWNAGLSAGRLLSTNVLLYDAALGGVYYEGQKDINKTQINLSTGFSLRFAAHNGWQWNAGPEIYFNTTRLFENAYDKDKHAVYGGLHVQALMPVKKKR